MSGWTKVPRYYGEGLCSPARPSGPGLPGPQHWALQSKGLQPYCGASSPSIQAFPDSGLGAEAGSRPLSGVGVTLPDTVFGELVVCDSELS